MPWFSVVVLILTFLQWKFYLLTFPQMSKWLSLLDKSFIAIPGFLILFLIILTLLFFMYKALGCSFDDG